MWLSILGSNGWRQLTWPDQTAQMSSFLVCMQVTASLKQVRDRIKSVKNTKKITDAMKLVAAAKVRRAQDAVINGRPFAENLVKVRLPTLQALGAPLMAPGSGLGRETEFQS